MKPAFLHYPLGLFLLSATLFSSCAAYHYSVTRVNDDLSLTRTVYVHADSAALTGEKFADGFFFDTEEWQLQPVDTPFVMDFYGETGIMNVSAGRKYGSLPDGTAYQAKEAEMRGNPLLSPEESLHKTFCWFFTRYDYSIKYDAIDDIPIPITGYLDSLELDALLREGSLPRYWNGIEVYSSLDELNDKFFKWYGDNIFKMTYDVVYGFSDEQMRILMKEYSEDVRKTVKDATTIKPDILCKVFDEVSGKSLFADMYFERKSEIDEAYARGMVIPEHYFSVAFLNELSMPGRLVWTDAPQVVDGKPRWKADAYRLLAGEMMVNASFRKANAVPLAITFILISVLFYILFRRLFNMT